MKNKDLICAGLLSLIIILTGITACYYVVKKDAYERQLINEKNNEEGQNEIHNINKNSQVKKLTTYNDFINYANKNTNTFMVFGKSTCHYCNMYEPILNNVSSEYGIEVIYVDLGALTQEDYYRVLNSSLMIPRKCNNSGVDIPLSSGFGTPLSLFVNSGYTYDCIRGYKDHDTLVGILRTIGYIK